MRHKTATVMKKDWFVRHSPQQTIRNMIEASDLNYLKSVSLPEFERILSREVEFVAPYSEEEIEEIKQYIHVHLGELHSLVKTLAEKGQGKHPA